MLRILIIAPFLILPVLLYILTAMSAGSGGTAASLGATLFSMPMMSGRSWLFTLGDLLLLAGLLCLFAEILKAVRPKGDSLVNHALSMFVLLFCLIAFLAMPGFQTSVFFLLTIMALLDVVAGPILSIVAARRDFGIGEGMGS